MSNVVDWTKPIECVVTDGNGGQVTVYPARAIATVDNLFSQVVAIKLDSGNEIVYTAKDDGYISFCRTIQNKVTKVTKWINVYRGSSPYRNDGDRERHPGVCFWDTEQEAKEGMLHPSYDKTIKVEWEE